MRRLFFILLLGLLAFSSCGASTKEFVWQRLDADVQVRADGSLAVTETLTLRYSGGPFSFAFRDLPSRRLDAISNISIGDGERVFEQVDDQESERPYTFSVAREDGDQRVRWVYPPTTGGQRTFVLRYDVAGAVRRQEQADEVWWSIAFPDREEPIEQASGRITLPQPVPVAQLDASAPDLAGTIERAPGAVSIQAANIPAGQELTLRLRFPKGIVGGGAPGWQARADTQDAYDATTRPTVNVVLSALAAGLALVFALLIWLWWRRNRDPQPQGFLGRELPAAPGDLPPAPAAKLLGQPGAQALLSTLLDLASRGYLTLEETKTGWRNRTTSVVATRTRLPVSELAPFEAATLAALGLAEAGSSVALDEQRAASLKALPALDKHYQAALAEAGLIDSAGLTRRRRGLTIGTLLLIIGGVAFVPAAILANRYSLWLPAVAGVVGLAGLIWLLIGAAVRGVTPAGADALARWRAFGRYLKRLTAEQAPSGQFEQLLPYAVSLADAGRLTKAYSQIGEPLPIWFYPALASHSSGPTSAGGVLQLQDFSQNFVAALTSASGSFGAGSAGASGAGGGASGGGGGGAG